MCGGESRKFEILLLKPGLRLLFWLRGLWIDIDHNQVEEVYEARCLIRR